MKTQPCPSKLSVKLIKIVAEALIVETVNEDDKEFFVAVRDACLFTPEDVDIWNEVYQLAKEIHWSGEAWEKLFYLLLEHDEEPEEINVKPIGGFHTPETVEDLEAIVDNLCSGLGTSAIVGQTIKGVTWNFFAHILR